MDKTLNDWLALNSEANHRRGKTTPNADPERRQSELWVGVCEELSEFVRASNDKPSQHLPACTERQEEAADLIITLATWLHDDGVDVERLIGDKVKFNVWRAEV